jgi:hypothetical protein
MICHPSLFHNNHGNSFSTRPMPSSRDISRPTTWQSLVSDYGNMIHWLEGEYINKHCDWTAVSNSINAVSKQHPTIARLSNHWIWESLWSMNKRGYSSWHLWMLLLQNHPGIEEEMDNVQQKLAKEEDQCFHITLPRVLWWFLPGIHLAPFIWAKRKGYLCVDPLSAILERTLMELPIHVFLLQVLQLDKMSALQCTTTLHSNVTRHGFGSCKSSTQTMTSYSMSWHPGHLP